MPHCLELGLWSVSAGVYRISLGASLFLLWHVSLCSRPSQVTPLQETLRTALCGLACNLTPSVARRFITESHYRSLSAVCPELQGSKTVFFRSSSNVLIFQTVLLDEVADLCRDLLGNWHWAAVPLIGGKFLGPSLFCSRKLAIWSPCESLVDIEGE